MSRQRFDELELAAELRVFPGLVERLLADHIPDADGRCRRCTLGGQAGHQRWPCRIYSYAAAALDRPASGGIIGGTGT